MTSAERREQIIQAATSVFGDRGYHGTTTDQVAKAAGISQPYVVRMFGTKEALFLEVINAALAMLLVSFREQLAEHRSSGEPAEALVPKLGNAFIDLVKTRGLHRSLMQGFVSGGDPVIGVAARRGFLEVYAFLRDEAGFAPEEVQTFLSYGMLTSVLLCIEMPSLFGRDSDATELACAAFGHKLDLVLETMGPDAASA
ncbi:TetR family transcriptional regulator [Frondihabitans sp. PhB188]|uniref:TetR/AcrR family transcriptional regulator n=1 Tax=Frondihabitans sp. PhB188 TaxID=2485200 RepID=UPI000FA9499B|nr:TetR/AcrR family transcriptional regulator [Frondihabitans sp. PhB188]ROQ39509.1 TetR family transcriptional regulator [Frondihabitans sp. PhB188]